MVELNRIRARLSGTRREPPQPTKRWHEGDLQPEVEAAVENGTEVDRVRSELEGQRDRARAELEATRAELSETKVRLEAELARSQEKGRGGRGGRRAERKFLQDRAEAMIAHLEAELQAERELREDLELALELFEKQVEEDTRAGEEAAGGPLEEPYASNGQGSADHIAPEVAEPLPEEPEPQSEAVPEPTADGWGVPLEAFPVTEPGEHAEGGDSDSAGTEPRSRSPRRLRRGGG